MGAMRQKISHRKKQRKREREATKKESERE